jgi:hypothetical protein
MDKIRFHVERGSVPAVHDAAIVVDGEDPHEQLVLAMVDSIAINVHYTAGGVTLFLAAWQDPDHWSDEWQEAGIEDPYAFILELRERQ